MKRYYGCHVSAAGGLENALKNGGELRVNTVQIHPSPPQRWNSKPFAAGVEDKFLAARAGSCVEKVFFHAIYLINLATPDPRNLELSKRSLLYYLDLSARVSGAGVIFHVGSLKDQTDEAHALRQVTDTMNWIMEESANDSRLIMEVAAGSGKVVGSKVEQLAEIYRGIEQKDRVGFGLDTQHLWASGYNLREDLEKVVEAIDSAFAANKIWAIHLNDSKTEMASKKDRHENLGDGLIGREALLGFINHDTFREIPVVLETPGLKSMDTAAGEVEKLREMIGVR